MTDAGPQAGPEASGPVDYPPPENPRFGSIWLKNARETLAWDGDGWVPYDEMPPWPGGGDPDPLGTIRDHS